jgi:hypothetical protein
VYETGGSKQFCAKASVCIWIEDGFVEASAVDGPFEVLAACAKLAPGVSSTRNVFYSMVGYFPKAEDPSFDFLLTQVSGAATLPFLVAATYL